MCYESNDSGALYTGRSWTMRGTVIRNNYLHHINGLEGRGCVGIYLDDQFCGTEVYGNVFYEVTRAAMIGGGRDCTIENNIFVDCVPATHVDAAHQNFQLKDDSPAYKLGFKRIPMEKIGLYQDELRASWPVQHTIRPAR